jgi:single-strand DNA-binding protein
MNSNQYIGRLVRDVETKTTPTGKIFASFTIAVDRRIKTDKGPNTDFIPIIVWGKTAENCAKYLSKGKKVGIDGELQTRNYTAKDGSKKYIFEILANSVEFLTPPDKTSNNRTSEQDITEPDNNEYDSNDKVPF